MRAGPGIISGALNAITSVLRRKAVDGPLQAGNVRTKQRCTAPAWEAGARPQRAAGTAKRKQEQILLRRRHHCQHLISAQLTSGLF